MTELIHWAYTKKFEEKTEKSFINIITGQRTHQTYFDALLQGLLPFYQLESNVNAIDYYHEFKDNIHFQSTLYPYFYPSMRWTFIALSLMTQVNSAKTFHIKEYLPVTNQRFIQSAVKSALHLQKKSGVNFKEELLNMYQSIASPKSYLSLPRYDGVSFPLNHLKDETYVIKLFIEMNHLTHLLANHPVYHPLYIRMPLHSSTNKTFQMLSDQTIEMISKEQRVKRHTIEDHITEILIKDYPLDIFQFITTDEYNNINQIRAQNHFQKLKPYYEYSDVKDYFKIKLALIQSVKEDNI